MNAETQAKIVSKEVQDFIFANEGQDEASLLLKHKELFGISFIPIAQQLVGRRKAKSKLPTWFQSKGILYPPSINIEQSSSEATAQYKYRIIAEVIKNKNEVADLTTGFGVDSFFFSKFFKGVHCVEPNGELLDITKHNYAILHATNIQYYQLKAEEFLETTKLKFDLIYVDPSRRDEDNKKLFRLADTTPNVVELQSLFFEHTDFILIKASPLLDIQQGLSEIKNVAQVFVVSVGNECKELLFFATKNYSLEPTIIAVDLTKSGEVVQQFTFYLSAERAAASIFSDPLEYLYEPNAAILKSGAFKLMATNSGVFKIGTNTHFYTSSELVNDFPGRAFKIIRINPKAAEWKNLLPDRKANVVTRNYPMSPDELKKKLELKDGGEKFVIGCSGEHRKFILLATRIK